jgi:ethanolamine ammonia-lyase small subunit
MDEQEIQKIVASVLTQLGESAPSGKVQIIPADTAPPATANVAAAGSMYNAPSAATGAVTAPPGAEPEGAGLDDLGDAKYKSWLGIDNAANPAVNEDLMRQTTARICVGRAGPRPRTVPLLRFLADHSRSKDTVTKEVSSAWLEGHDLLEVQTQITSKEQYLTRPDLGRKLSPEARQILEEKCAKGAQVQLVISDGLSTDAVTHNYEELLPPLLNGLKNAGLSVGTPFFLRYGRVKAQDEIGELLGAEANVLLIGERPGLGQSESLSCYAIYRPSSSTVESDRTVISNIHQGGTPPVEAAAVIVDLVKAMLAQKTSGIALQR